MAVWLILLLIGVVMIVLGIAITEAKVLLWIGIGLLVIGLIGWLMGRGRSRRPWPVVRRKYTTIEPESGVAAPPGVISSTREDVDVLGS